MSGLVKAHYRYLRITPRKTRHVADLVRGMSVQEAEAQLLCIPQRAARPILKLLRSAMANAWSNAKLDPEQLVIREIRVDQGPKLKRYTPRARGSSAKIEKKLCHITIVLGESVNGAIPLKRFEIKRISLKDKEKSKRVKASRSKKDSSADKKKGDVSQNDPVSVHDSKSEKDVKASKVTVTKEPGVFKKVFRRKSV